MQSGGKQKFSENRKYNLSIVTKIFARYLSALINTEYEAVNDFPNIKSIWIPRI